MIEMSIRENIALRFRTSFGLIVCGILFMFVPKAGQIEILDFLATRFRNFRGASGKDQ